jgi:hypothetical protein
LRSTDKHVDSELRPKPQTKSLKLCAHFSTTIVALSGIR